LPSQCQVPNAPQNRCRRLQNLPAALPALFVLRQLIVEVEPLSILDRIFTHDTATCISMGHPTRRNDNRAPDWLYSLP
jgi:hypothetical protein